MDEDKFNQDIEQEQVRVNRVNDRDVRFSIQTYLTKQGQLFDDVQ